MVAGTVGVVPDVVCLPVSVLPVLVVDAPVPAVFSPVAFAKVVGESCGVASAVGAVFSLVGSAARLAASSR